MDINTSLLLIAAIFNIFLGTVILIHGPRTKKDITYAVLVLALVLWILTILAFRAAVSLQLAVFSLATAYFSGVAIAAIFWHFTIFFKDEKPRLFESALVIITGAGVALTAFFSGDFIRGISMIGPDIKAISAGPLHYIFVIYFIAVMFDAFRRLFHSYKENSAKEARAQLGLMLVGTLVTTIIGGLTNVIFVQFGISEYIGWGPVATIIMVSFIGYAIMRHNLLSVRVVGAEFFTLSLLMVILGQLAFSRSTNDLVLTAVAFVFAAAFGGLLIRSVLKEIKSNERIAKLAKELAESNEELKKLDQAKSEFISLASHQLRAPLTVIRGYLSMVLERSFGAVSKEVERPLENSLSSTEQLTHLVNDLLDLSRIEAGRMQYDFQPVVLRDIVKKAIGAFEESAKIKKMDIIFRDNTKTPQRILGDSYKLHEAFSNLIDNSIKYSQDAPITVILEIADIEGGHVRVAINDKGVGIREEDIPKLFTKFWRSEETQKIQSGGMGIGLYLVKKIIEDHHGRVWAESAGLHHGSTFFVEFPILRQAPN